MGEVYVVQSTTVTCVEVNRQIDRLVSDNQYTMSIKFCPDVNVVSRAKVA